MNVGPSSSTILLFLSGPVGAAQQACRIWASQAERASHACKARLTGRRRQWPQPLLHVCRPGSTNSKGFVQGLGSSGAARLGFRGYACAGSGARHHPARHAAALPAGLAAACSRQRRPAVTIRPMSPVGSVDVKFVYLVWPTCVDRHKGLDVLHQGHDHFHRLGVVPAHKGGQRVGRRLLQQLPAGEAQRGTAQHAACAAERTAVSLWRPRGAA